MARQLRAEEDAREGPGLSLFGTLADSSCTHHVSTAAGGSRFDIGSVDLGGRYEDEAGSLEMASIYSPPAEAKFTSWLWRRRRRGFNGVQFQRCGRIVPYATHLH